LSTTWSPYVSKEKDLLNASKQHNIVCRNYSKLIKRRISRTVQENLKAKYQAQTATQTGCCSTNPVVTIAMSKPLLETLSADIQVNMYKY
jgi:hypothetical protein